MPARVTAAASARGSSWSAGTSYAGRLNIASAVPAKRRVLARERVEDRPHLVERRRLRFARQGAPLHLQRRAIRDSCSARGPRRRSTHAASRCRPADAAAAPAASHRALRAASARGPGAGWRPALPRGRLPCAALPSTVDVDPREPLVSDRDRQIGRLGHDRRVGASTSSPARRRRCSNVLRRRPRRRSAGPTRGRRAAATCAAADIIAATPPFMSCAPRP